MRLQVHQNRPMDGPIGHKTQCYANARATECPYEYLGNIIPTSSQEELAK